MNDLAHLTDAEIALLAANFPHQPNLTDDQYEAWLLSAWIAYSIVSASE